jgi:hypothetical protein
MVATQETDLLILAQEAILQFLEEEKRKTEIQIILFKEDLITQDKKDRIPQLIAQPLLDLTLHHQIVVDHQEVTMEEEDQEAQVAVDPLEEEEVDNTLLFFK